MSKIEVFPIHEANLEGDIHEEMDGLRFGRALVGISVKPPLKNVGGHFSRVILGPDTKGMKLHHIGSTARQTDFLLELPRDSTIPEDVVMEAAGMVTARIDSYANHIEPAASLYSSDAKFPTLSEKI